MPAAIGDKPSRSRVDMVGGRLGEGGQIGREGFCAREGGECARVGAIGGGREGGRLTGEQIRDRCHGGGGGRKRAIGRACFV